MKLFFFIAFLLTTSLSCFGQANGSNIIKEITKTITASDQDTSKTKTGQSNLAVSDPGSSSGKPKGESKPAVKQQAEPQKKNTSSTETTPATDGKSDKMAVSDPGSSGSKPTKGKTQTRETSGGTTTQEQEPVKEKDLSNPK